MLVALLTILRVDTDILVHRPDPAVKQGLQGATGKQRDLYPCGDESPDGQEIGLPARRFGMLLHEVEYIAFARQKHSTVLGAGIEAW